MKFTTAFVAVAATLPALSHALFYNKTQAYQPGNFDKYSCMSTSKANQMLPQCLHQCQISANLQDGCAYDDITCHCVNYNTYSPLIEHCAFPPALGGVGTCTFQELGQIRSTVQDMCNFLNATLYTAQAKCLPLYSPQKTFELVGGQEVVITGQ